MLKQLIRIKWMHGVFFFNSNKIINIRGVFTFGPTFYSIIQNLLIAFGEDIIITLVVAHVLSGWVKLKPGDIRIDATLLDTRLSKFL